jgi:hypothetical protein
MFGIKSGTACIAGATGTTVARAAMFGIAFVAAGRASVTHHAGHWASGAWASHVIAGVRMAESAWGRGIGHHARTHSLEVLIPLGILNVGERFLHRRPEFVVLGGELDDHV